MAFDKEYYEGKKKKLQEKFQKVKDVALQEFININNRLVSEINEINQESSEIETLLKENMDELETPETPVVETPEE